MTITPLLEPEMDATPLAKLIGVAVPKATAVPEELLTVGLLASGLADAPPNVRLCEPV